MNTEFIDSYKSPIGTIIIKSNARAITDIGFFDEPAPIPKTNPVIEECKKQLDEYFKGKRKSFDIPLEPSGTVFQKNVWDKLLEIEYGRNVSYQDIAIKVGNIKACRPVGGAIGKNPIPIIIPCHRVIGKNGSLTGFACGLERKSWLLEHERTYSKSG